MERMMASLALLFSLGSRSHHGPIFHYDDDSCHHHPHLPQHHGSDPLGLMLTRVSCYDFPHTGVSHIAFPDSISRIHLQLIKKVSFESEQNLSSTKSSFPPSA